jgi:SAM-dependent methyltransferase
MDEVVYRQYAECFEDHWWTDHRHRIFEMWLANEGVQPDGSRRVLEIGSGAGTEHWWLKRYGSVTGVELSPAGLKFCRERGYNELIADNLNTVSLPEQRFGLCVDFHVLYHHWIESPSAVLARLFQATEPGGYLLLTETAHEYLRRGHDEAVMAKRRFARRELEQLVQGAGFEVVRMSGFLTLLLPAVWLSLLLDRLRHQHEVSELEPPARWVDRTLRIVMALERLLMRLFPLPTGTCWAVLARRPL